MNSAEFSVVVPVFNRSEMVQRLINSLEEQSLKPLEIILVDDLSSSDEHFALTRIASRSVLNVVVVRATTKLYAEGARRLGAEQCSSEILIFIDSDNVLPHHFCAEMASVFATTPSALLGCKTYYLDIPNRVWFESVEFSLWTALATYRIGADSDLVEYVETHHCPNIFMCLRSTFLTSSEQKSSYGIPMEEAALAIRACQATSLPCHTNLRTFAFHDVGLPLGGNFYWDGLLALQRMTNLLRNKRRIVREFGTWPQRLFYSCIFRYITLVGYVLVNFRVLTKQRVLSMIRGTFSQLD